MEDRATVDEATYRRLLVPLDGSAEAELALPHALALASAFQARLHLIRVVTSVGGATPMTGIELPLEGGMPALGALPDPEADPEVIGATIYLEDVARRLREDGHTVDAVVRTGPVAAAVLEEASAGDADLVVIAAAPRAGLARLVLGDVADELLRRASCPVFYVRSEPALEPETAKRLRNFADDLALAGATLPVPLGLREVPIDRIVGTVGRARDLDADFLPLNARRRQDDRFKRIAKAMEDGAALPPIQLYKLGYNYYVLDGHHRIAVARSRGVREMDADVTEYLSSSNAIQQRVFSERREFERRTGVVRIGATRPGTYPRLLEMIEEFAESERRAQGIHGAQGTSGNIGSSAAEDELKSDDLKSDEFKQVAARWYYTFFKPLAGHIRARHLGRAFPGERTADILVRLRDFRAEEARLGHEVSWESALEHFAAAYDSTHPWRGWDLRRSFDLRRFMPAPRRRPDAPAPEPEPGQEAGSA